MKDDNWSLTGNAGTDPDTNFLGTTDQQPLIFKVGGQEAMRIDTLGNVGNVGIGITPSPEYRLSVESVRGEEKGGLLVKSGGTMTFDMGKFKLESEQGASLSIDFDNDNAAILRARDPRGNFHKLILMADNLDLNPSGEFSVLGNILRFTMEQEDGSFTKILMSLLEDHRTEIRCEDGSGLADLIIDTRRVSIPGGVRVGDYISPETTLHVSGDRIRLQNVGPFGTRTKKLDMRVDGGAVDLHSETDDLFIRSSGPQGHNHVLINPFGQFGDGNVGIGTTTPQAKLHVQGDLLVTGTKSFVQASPVDSTKEIVYVALEGGEAGTYIRGTGELDNGKATIELPEHFSLLTSEEGLTVQLTSRGEWLQIYVAQLNSKQIVVQEAQGKSGQFDYQIQGVRKGYEHHQVIREKQA